MLKYFVLFSCLFCFLNCKTYKLHRTESVRLIENSQQNFEFIQSKILLQSKIDGNLGNFMFDTGANTTLVFDTILVKNFHAKTKGNFGKIKDAQRNTISKQTFHVHFENNLVQSENKVATYIPSVQNSMFDKCQKESTSKIDGILGMDSFKYPTAHTSLFLNFEESKLELITGLQLDSLKLNGFQEIKSKFDAVNQLYIYLTLNEKEYKFRFDTGFTSTLVMPYKEVEHFQSFTPIQIFGSNYTTLTGMSSGNRTNYYENVPINMMGISTNSTIQLTENLSIYNVGIQFIRLFDWVLDYYEKKIYFRQNGNTSLYKTPEIQIKTFVENEQLKIKLVGENYISKFSVGDQIKSFNGEIVRPDTLCEMMDFVNSSKNIDELNIEIEKVLE